MVIKMAFLIDFIVGLSRVGLSRVGLSSCYVDANHNHDEIDGFDLDSTSFLSNDT